MRAWRRGIPDMENTPTPRHALRARVSQGRLLRPDSARETLRAYSSKKTTSSQRPLRPGSQHAA
eukprot:3241574-Pleurochrysis_carterae.AAC.1